MPFIYGKWCYNFVILQFTEGKHAHKKIGWRHTEMLRFLPVWRSGRVEKYRKRKLYVKFPGRDEMKISRLQSESGNAIRKLYQEKVCISVYWCNQLLTYSHTYYTHACIYISSKWIITQSIHLINVPGCQVCALNCKYGLFLWKNKVIFVIHTVNIKHVYLLFYFSNLN